MEKTILFVCTGNTCRSPMAESLLKQLAEKEGLAITCKSAGVAAMEGNSISNHSRKILEDKGARTDLISQPVDVTLVKEADLILTMTMSHKRQMLSRYPDADGKIYTLKEYAGTDDKTVQEWEGSDREKAELIVKQSLSGGVTAAEKTRALFLDMLMEQDQDISDPFGGSLGDYRVCASEIEEALIRLVAKLKKQ